MTDNLSAPEALSQVIQSDLDHLRNQQAISDIAKTIGIAAATGGGLAALVGLLARLREPEEPESVRETTPVLAVETPAVAAKAAGAPATKRAQAARLDEPGWQLPLQLAGGGLAAYAAWRLIKHLTDRAAMADLEKQKEQAKSEFDAAIAQAMGSAAGSGRAPGLKLAAVLAAGDPEFQAGMEIIEAMADDAVERVSRPEAALLKRAGISDWLSKVPSWAWWLIAPMFGVPAILGASVGYGMAKKQNPYRTQLAQVKKRETLRSIQAPVPVLALLRRRQELEGEDEERREEEEVESGGFGMNRT